MSTVVAGKIDLVKSLSHNGVTYNYYYTMSSGARVYILVL